MGKSEFCTAEDLSAWERVKKAFANDWEQTKADFGSKSARDMDQDVDDTVKQAAGIEPIPPPGQPTKSSNDRALTWDEVEGPMRFGYGARQQYGAQHQTWNDHVEKQLRTDWEAGSAGSKWDEVKAIVRRGYERLH